MKRATHTVTDPGDKTGHRPQLPPACWAVIDAWQAEHGVPAYPLPL